MYVWLAACVLYQAATAVLSVSLSGLSVLNCKGTAGCWRSSNLLADSMFHSRTHFAKRQTDVSSPLPDLLAPDQSKTALGPIKTKER